MVKCNVPLADLGTTACNLHNVFKDFTIDMVNELLFRQSWTGYEDLLRIEDRETSLDWYFDRVTVEETEEELKRAGRDTNVVKNGSFLVHIPVKPTQIAVGNPRLAYRLCKRSASFATASGTTKPDNLHVILGVITSFVNEGCLEAMTVFNS